MHRLVSTLDTAADALPFVLSAQPNTQRHDGKEFLRRVKAASETALLLYACARAVNADAVITRVHKLAERLASVVRSDETLTWMRLRPALVGELSIAHLCLKAAGFPSAHFDRQLHRIIATSNVGIPERAPWKDLEALWHQQMGGPRLNLNWTRSVGRAAISQPQDVLFATHRDLYAYTHALIYATDWGHQPLGERWCGRERLLRDTESVLARCLDADDFDLSAELLLTWPYLRSKWSPTATFAFLVATHVEDAVGILPSLNLRHDEFAALESPDARARYFYQGAYHTAYVMGFLLAATLLPESAPPSHAYVEHGASAMCAARELRDLLLPKSPPPQWQIIFNTLAPRQQAALLPLLADVAIHRAIKAADYARVREILSIFLSVHVQPTSATIQAAELLVRLSDTLTAELNWVD